MNSLTMEQFNVLIKIARKTKMDCWFSIRKNNSKGIFVHDIENGKDISLRHGVKQLTDGLTDVDFLTETEKMTFIMLLGQLI